MIGIISALEPEIATLRRIPSHFRVAVSGMGEQQSYVAARRLAAAGAQALVSWGCAAALDRALTPGTLLVPSIIVGERARYDVDLEWRAALMAALGNARIDAGVIANAERVLSNAAAKLELSARSGASAADMESAGIAAAASELGLPFLVVRALADDVDLSVPPPLVRTVGDNGSLDVTGAALRLALRPWHWPAAVRLGLAFNRALLALRSAAPALYASASAHGAAASRPRGASDVACVVGA